MSDDVRRSVGDALRSARKSLGYTQQDTADVLGVSQVTISHWENARRTPDVVDLTNLAVAYRTTPSALLASAPVDANTDISERSKALAEEINARLWRERRG